MKTKKRRDVLSAFKEANRSIELERNGGVGLQKTVRIKTRRSIVVKIVRKSCHVSSMAALFVLYHSFC